MPAKAPKYRFHKARDLAVVTIGGRDHYLGAYDSPESREKYHRLVAEFLAARSDPLPAIASPPAITITELIAKYWQFSKTYYVKNHQPTSELSAIKLALRFVRKLYGRTAAHEFSPKKLKAVQEAMIAHEMVRTLRTPDANGVVVESTKVVRRGLARRCINKLISRVRRMFAWAVEEELVAVEVHAALLRVSGLKKGKTAARETAPVTPVSEEHIAAVVSQVSPVIAVMIEIQRLCGARPQEVVQMRVCDIDCSGPIWEFRPPRHKTEHHDGDGPGHRERVIFLGPQCQRVLQPLLIAAREGYLFAPRSSGAVRTSTRTSGTERSLVERQSTSPTKKRVNAPPSEHYSVSSYRQAIRRACLRADIPVWKPNQLRHSRLTEIRKKFGLEASRVIGGHREVGVTQIYAEQDQGLARRIMEQIG